MGTNPAQTDRSSPLTQPPGFDHLRWPVTLTRLGMWAEAIVRAFWPLWSVAFVATAPALFGWHETIGVELLWGWVVFAGLLLLAAVIWGARQFRAPRRAEAIARVDAQMPGRPIAAVTDSQAIGSGDAASEAVWQAHLARMAERTRDAKAAPPDLRVSQKDPYGLRFLALLFFLCALMFGSLWRVNTVGETIGTGEQTLATGPVWEGWVTPPAYTGKPTIYLNDIPAGLLRVAAGSTITLRLYGDVGALTVAETVSARTQDIGAASDQQQTFIVAQSGELSIDGENGISWTIAMIEDQEPLVELSGAIESDAMGELSQPFLAMDDYGVESGTAEIALDLSSVDRRYGLATDPDPREPLVLDLPMPFTGDRTDFEEFLIENLSEHPLANLPVTLTLDVTDAAGQVGQAEPEQMILPGRRFFQPTAKAVIELRRDLMWSTANAPRVAQVLRAVSHRPEDMFTGEVTYLRVRAIIRRLEGLGEAGLDAEAQAEIVDAMWDLAIQLEEGTLADARERLRRAQERLEEAMRNGASDEEIAELMQELRDATDAYMQMLADQMEPGEPSTDQPDMSQDSQELSMDEIQALMDRIQELMEEGRMAEAQELMEQLNQLLENLRITQGQGGGQGGPRTPGQQSMEDLAETLRDQEDLSDEAFRELQERSQRQDGQQSGQQGQQGQQGQEQGQNQGQQGQQGQGQQQQGQQGQGTGTGREGQQGQQGDTGQGGEGVGNAPDARELAERQRALREELQRQQDGLPNLGGEAGDIARQSLDRAEGAMEGAEDALRDGDLAGAIDRQAEAMDALRNGLRSLGDALAQNQPQEPGQGTENGETFGQARPGQRDPLGREAGNTGQFGTDENLLQGEDVYRRAEELLGEIRRRSAEQNRPEVERDYLRRLLDRF